MGWLLAVADRVGAPSVLRTAVSPAGPVRATVLIEAGTASRDRPDRGART